MCQPGAVVGIAAIRLQEEATEARHWHTWSGVEGGKVDGFFVHSLSHLDHLSAGIHGFEAWFTVEMFSGFVGKVVHRGSSKEGLAVFETIEAGRHLDQLRADAFRGVFGVVEQAEGVLSVENVAAPEVGILGSTSQESFPPCDAMILSFSYVY